MVENSRNRESDAEGEASGIEGKLEDEVDALFKLPLAEFTGARNDLAARLKRGGHANDATLVKALAKPSVSVWAVNQLYWNHREAFGRLLAAGQRFREAQASRTADMRESLEAQRESLLHLSELAASLLRDAGHNPAADTIHRITTTLEAVSAYASLSDGPTPGRLTRDVDPPGFEALASLITHIGAAKAKEDPAPSVRSSKPESTDTHPRQEASASILPSPEQVSAGIHPRQEAPPSADLHEVRQQEARRLEEMRRAGIAAAKASLQDAGRSLTEATAAAERLEAAQKKACEEANQAEKELRESEERLKKASAASRDAIQRSQSIAAEARDAAKAVEDAKRNVEKASQELESLLIQDRNLE